MLRTILGSAFVTVALAGAAPAQPQMFFETQTEHCTISAAADPNSNVLRVDMVHKVIGRSCALTREETVELFSSVFKPHAETGDRAVYGSLMVGHLSDYGWMQRHLMETARGDPDWSQEAGRPKTGHANAYVNAVLSLPAVTEVFNLAGGKHNYGLAAMDCEKVFISDDGLPIDAFCWAEIARK